jgi:tetratricopeptide (TPR) repeat protein
MPRSEHGAGRADSGALVERGWSAFDRGDLDAAARAFEEALAAGLEPGEALLGLGKIALQRGDVAQATARFEQAIDAEPAPPEASVALARLRDLAGRLEDALDTLWLAVHRHPEHAEAWLALGRLLARSGRLKEAEECLERACAARPDWHEPSVELARVLQRMRRYAEAVTAFRRALELAPCPPEVHNDLANCLVYLQRNDEALTLLEDLVRRHPRSLVPRLGYANALFQLGRFDEAGAQYDLIRSREPENPFMNWNRSLLLLQQHRFDEGWTWYERRLLALTDNHPRVFPFPRWRGEPLAGKTVLVYAEQGLGDEIMFASCLDELLAQAGHCIVECNPKLAAIFARSFPAATVLAAEERAVPSWMDRLAGVDFQVAAGSLPGVFRRSAARFPGRAFLKPDPAKVARWRRELERLGDGPKIGISWRGGSVRTRAVARSVGLADWAPILDVPGCRFVSLQYGDVAAELRELNASGTRRVEVWQDALDDYDETAALVCALDLVVTVCTALVHLSGGLGQQAWVLVPSIPEWRYGVEGERMPWYGSVELVRQPGGEPWRPTLERVGRRLAAYAAGRRGAAAG